MKAITYSLAAAAVALSASALSIPEFYRRAAQQSKGIACTTRMLATGQMSPDCESAMGVNFGVLKSASADHLRIDFASGNDPNVLGISSTRFSADLLSIPGLSWPVTHCAHRVNVIDNGVRIATFTTPSSEVTANDNKYGGAVSNSPFKIAPNKQEEFARFVGSLFTQEAHTITLNGGLDPTLQLDLPLGIGQRILTAPNIGFETPMTLRGFNNFAKVGLAKHIDWTLNPTTGTYSLKSILNIYNPSQIEVVMGDVSFQAFDESGALIAPLAIKDFKLDMGDNSLPITAGPISKESYKTLTTTGTTLTIQGYEGSSSNPVVKQVLKELKFSVPAFPFSPAA
ncbi:hypothetical protein B0O80DRAFT_459814 [Mortierella sp. GBAus27b]|nr:hypothetical protein BGX31_002704 [Mortierella sp. GBA43]KAI8349563.1 hypothetical protein B0O80DRAFT_459814 [Mortierella sp. GBAus27b]